MKREWTVPELLALPPVIDLETAGSVFNVGRTVSHELARADQFPVPVLRLGVQYRVPTAPILRLLGLTPAAPINDSEVAG